MHFEIALMTKADWPQVAEIYRQGIASGNATFEQDVPSWERWLCNHITPCNLVAKYEDTVLGWVSLAPISGRCVFTGVAEVSIYLAKAYQGQGLGYALLTKEITVAEENGFWTLESGIFPENKGSIELHKKCGFRIVGTRERIGKMPGTNRWRDIILMERRSAILF